MNDRPAIQQRPYFLPHLDALKKRIHQSYSYIYSAHRRVSTSASRRTLSLRAHYIRRLLRFNAALATVTYIVWGSVFEWPFAAIFGGYSPTKM